MTAWLYPLSLFSLLDDGTRRSIVFGRTGDDRTGTNSLHSSQLKAARSTIMGESSQSTPSLSPNSSPSSVPSPALSTLSLTDLKEVSDKDRQEAARLKADANKAFLGMLSILVALLTR